MADASRIVLIVEDAELCASTLEIALAAIPGLEIRWSSTAEEALRHIEEDRIAAVITDLHLPAMDGFDLVRHLRAMPSLAGVPIVVISGDSDPQVSRRVFALGANAFFSKPFSPAEVRNKVEQLIYAH